MGGRLAPRTTRVRRPTGPGLLLRQLAGAIRNRPRIRPANSSAAITARRRIGPELPFHMSVPYPSCRRCIPPAVVSSPPGPGGDRDDGGRAPLVIWRPSGASPGRDVAGRLGSRGRPHTRMTQADRTPRGRGPGVSERQGNEIGTSPSASCTILIGPRDNWVGRPRIGWEKEMGVGMAQATAKGIAKSGKRMGKKVLATDTAQDVVGVVVDGLEEVAVDKADDVAENVKARAARAGGRSSKSAAANKSSSRKSPAKRPTAKKSATRKSGAKKPGAKKPTKKPSPKRAGARGGDGSKVTGQAGGCERSPRPSGQVPRSRQPARSRTRSGARSASGSHGTPRSGVGSVASIAPSRSRIRCRKEGGSAMLAVLGGSASSASSLSYWSPGDHLLRTAHLKWDSFAGRSWVRNEGWVSS